MFGPEEIRLKLSNYYPMLIMVGAAMIYYFVLLPFVFPGMKPTNDEARNATKKMRDWHNFFLFIYSGFSCGACLYYLYVNNELFDWKAIMCNPVEGTWLRPVSVIFVVSKIYEWGDTAFKLWLGTKKESWQQEFLHNYHHATTFWLFCIVINLPGPEKFGLLLNGGVHTLMYSHYWRSWPKALVPLITILQILQLSTVIVAWTTTPSDCPNARFAVDAYQNFPEYLTPYFMVPVYLFFFLLFFAERFCGCGGNKSKSKLQAKKVE